MTRLGLGRFGEIFLDLGARRYRHAFTSSSGRRVTGIYFIAAAKQPFVHLFRPGFGRQSPSPDDIPVETIQKAKIFTVGITQAIQQLAPATPPLWHGGCPQGRRAGSYYPNLRLRRGASAGGASSTNRSAVRFVSQPGRRPHADRQKKTRKDRGNAAGMGPQVLALKLGEEARCWRAPEAG